MEPATEADRVTAYAEFLGTVDRIAEVLEVALNSTKDHRGGPITVRTEVTPSESRETPYVVYVCEETRVVPSDVDKFYRMTYRLGEHDMDTIQTPQDYGNLIKQIHLVFKYEFEKAMPKPDERERPQPGEWYEATGAGPRWSGSRSKGFSAENINKLVRSMNQNKMEQEEAIKSIMKSAEEQ